MSPSTQAAKQFSNSLPADSADHIAYGTFFALLIEYSQLCTLCFSCIETAFGCQNIGQEIVPKAATMHKKGYSGKTP
jgi:hypothetical protein